MARRQLQGARKPLSRGFGEQDGTPFEGLADRQLLGLAAARHGDGRCAERAFEVLVKRHGAMVLTICRQILGDEHAAEDAFQVTFSVLAGKAGSLERPELLGHWLYGVAVRTARKSWRLRDQRRRWEGPMVHSAAEPIAARDTDPAELCVIRREQAELLHEELVRLPEKYRVPLVLCDLEGLTHAEAARRLGWPLGTIGVRLLRGRAALRARLVRRGLGPIAGLLVTALVSETAAANVSPTLADATVRHALRSAPGRALTISLGTASASTLTAMAFLAILMTGLLVTGVGALGPAPAESRVAELPETGSLAAGALETQAPVRSRPEDAADPEAQTETGPVAFPTDAVAVPRAGTGPAGLATAYRRLAARLGRDAAAHVRLALWCEAHGLDPERVKHLTLATLIDPGHTTARGLLGQVDHRGRWLSAEAVATRVRDDGDLSVALAEYNARRQKAANTPDAQWRLALWCEHKGLAAEAKVHLRAVTRLDPEHEAARKRLGYTRVRGRWLSAAQVAAQEAEVEARKADRLWRSTLVKWRDWLGDPERRDQSERLLAGVCEPYAVPAVWAVFGAGDRADQARAVQLLGQIDAPAATRALAVLALASPAPEVRRTSCETLARRDPRDFMGLLIGLLRDPDPNPKSILFRFRLLPTGALNVGSPGIVVVEGRRANFVRFYTVDESRRPSFLGYPAIPTSGYAWRVALQHSRQIREVNLLVNSVIAQTAGEMALIMAAIRQDNAKVIQVLRNITGEDRGESWEAWKRWWVEELGYAYDPDRFRNPPDNSSFFAPKPTYVTRSHLSCFGAGTPVRTLTGPRPIESIRPGDQVLTQDAGTGLLSFAPVLAIAHNPPAPTLGIELETSGKSASVSTPIVATGIHRFWKAGRGWIMARDLRPGDVVRTLDGAARVAAVAAGRVEPVFNLEVGEAQSFFVGQSGALVHDNSLVEPVAHPFDAFEVFTADLDPGH